MIRCGAGLGANTPDRIMGTRHIFVHDTIHFPHIKKTSYLAYDKIKLPAKMGSCASTIGLARQTNWRAESDLHMAMSAEELLRAMFAAAVAAAQPEVCLPPFLPQRPAGRLVVIGAGKASAAMAEIVEHHFPGPLEGIVVTRERGKESCRQIEIIEAGHPIPDARSVEAARRILSQVQGLARDDLVLCLISGGGSALLALPAPGLSLAEKQSVTQQLLTCGANISEINCVRRHLSSVKGGRLAAACHPARLLTLMMSDVPGDREIDIASGPTVADPTTCVDALDIVRRYKIVLPAAAGDLIESGRGESIKPGDPRLVASESHIVVRPREALLAAAAVARRAGVEPVMLGDLVEGEAREVGKVMGGIALSAARHGVPAPPPCVLISGGETSVTVEGDGCGGRNVEFLLSLAIALDGEADVHALAADTDGIDGVAEVAGATIAPDTLARATGQGMNARDFLTRNDAHSFFKALGNQVVTGPTRTNVNDFRAILIMPRKSRD
jgi:glycerate 2-kinase